MRLDAPSPRRRAIPAQRVAIGLALVLLATLIALWFARKPIATGYITRTLVKAGVPARYTLAELGPGPQRLTGVVIGDPAHPDLVADWIETETRIDLAGAHLTGLRAGHVRLRGRLAGGRLSLGTIDRLLPTASGQPLALPALDLAVQDARMRLTSAAGTVGLKLMGQGRLDDGFHGTIAAVADRLAASGCAGTNVAAAVRVTTRAGRPMLAGPVRAGRFVCGGARVAGIAADMDAMLAADLVRWQGQAKIATRQLAASGSAASSAHGSVSFAGDAAATRGRASMTFAAPQTASGTAAELAVTVAYRVGAAMVFQGDVRVAHATLAPALVARLTAAGMNAAGTPIGPLARMAARAAAVAASDTSGDATIALAFANDRGAVRLESARLASASGARLTLANGAGLRFGWPGTGATIDTDLALAGGGLPTIRSTLRQARPGAPISGVATIAPYAAADARLALTPVTFAAGAGGTTIATRATLSGPIAGGRIEALTVPIAARWAGSTLVVNDRCTSAGFDRVAVAGLALGVTRTGLCPLDGALLRIAGGRIGGGAAVRGLRLGGTLGGAPLGLAADSAAFRLADRGFILGNVHALLGPADRQTRLDIASLTGTAGAAIGGRFTGGAGQIANVPLLLSNASSDWRYASGGLALTGTLGVADAAGKDARFKPLAARGVTLTLANGRIDATGTLVEPTTGIAVADVAIRHDLASSAGTADLTVPGLAFAGKFQPDLLTPLTFGVIADVKGAIAGAGHIAWSPTAITSTGRFHTGGLDLAAAFGPVSGLAGEIVFTDLLSLQSAPGQVATVRTINPGIAVNDGRIVFQTLPGARIRVEGARWPFAGGTLTLDPTLLDFSAPAERRMTFHVDGAAADQFLQQFDFKNLDASGVFDGVLPMIFDADGGRIEKGLLTVRPGGGSIAYVGDLTQKDLGFWGNLAFQTLKSLRYRSLSITMNGPLSGEMVTAVRFAGVSQGKGAKSNFLIRRLQRLPFVFNVTIRAPFRGLLDSAASFYDPKRLIARNLPALLEEQKEQTNAPVAPKPAPPPAIQPPASRTVP